MPVGEFELIDRWFRRRARRSDVVLGVGDDAALLRVPQDRELVAATDTLVEGRHFLAGIEARSIGHQALAVNLSDLAAMGAEPAWALLSLSLPEVDESWLDEFSAGFFALADRYGIELVGGDTVRGPRVITVTALGLIEPGTALRRDGARPGDLVYVSGTPGEAAAGLELLRKGQREQSPGLVRRLLYAEPRLALGRALRGLASAAMDVSDGLAGDLARLCAASGVGAELELERLPVSPGLRALLPPTRAEHCVLHGGDDYELLFTLPAEREAQLADAIGEACTVTRIGRIVAHRGLHARRDDQVVDIEARGHDHFA
jgi:thiamine-monophosphate kinase